MNSFHNIWYFDTVYYWPIMASYLDDDDARSSFLWFIKNIFKRTRHIKILYQVIQHIFRILNFYLSRNSKKINLFIYSMEHLFQCFIYKNRIFICTWIGCKHGVYGSLRALPLVSAHNFQSLLQGQHQTKVSWFKQENFGWYTYFLSIYFQ